MGAVGDDGFGGHACEGAFDAVAFGAWVGDEEAVVLEGGVEGALLEDAPPHVGEVVGDGFQCFGGGVRGLGIGFTVDGVEGGGELGEGGVGFSGGEVGDDFGFLFDVAAVEVDGHEGVVVAPAASSVDGGLVLGGEVVHGGLGLFDEGADAGDLGVGDFVCRGGAGGVEPAFVVADLFLEGLGGVELVGVEEEEGELHVGAGGDGGVVDAVGLGGGDGAGHGVGEGPECGDLGGGVEVHDFEVLLDGFVGGVEAAAGAVAVDGGAEEEEALFARSGVGFVGGGDEFLGEVDEGGGFFLGELVGFGAEAGAVVLVVVGGVEGFDGWRGGVGAFLGEGEVGVEGFEWDLGGAEGVFGFAWIGGGRAGAGLAGLVVWGVAAAVMEVRRRSAVRAVERGSGVGRGTCASFRGVEVIAATTVSGGWGWGQEKREGEGRNAKRKTLRAGGVCAGGVVSDVQGFGAEHGQGPFPDHGTRTDGTRLGLLYVEDLKEVLGGGFFGGVGADEGLEGEGDFAAEVELGFAARRRMGSAAAGSRRTRVVMAAGQ